MPNFASRIVRFALKLLLGLFAALFALSLLAAALIVLAFSLLKALITGRKPAPAAVFGRFQQFSSQGMWPGSAKRENSGRGDDVVDVEVREVRVDRRLP
ncbi:hypothetical protein SAMN05216344_12027 [Polaromonas sp. OV174]|uniref:hypothetical protein n=1 Tax=Polaromonas sp. OV174 TaxID=1855300 RepID=UPI0008F1AF4A|nr:hypothetical protein [Polaromonas sp. OV174]SFC51518.1 hypothetical protein SAMN05216344_12027 [Polaromonas sp. OV174]